MDQRFEQTAFYPADILLPQTAEMKKWPVVACDQFTSQPDYWQAAEAAVGEAPSALRLVLPEVYLNGPDVDKRIETINASMDRCLADGLFRTLSDSLIYLERTQSDGRVRHGLIGCVDLEQYDFTPGSGALIRATEGTVLERIPPRVRVREHAALELPHVMLLIDDPRGSVIEPLTGETVGAAIAIKKGCRKAADAAAAIGEGLQAFCIPGSVADQRKVGLGHGNLGKMLLEEETDCFCFLAGHESFAAAEGAIGIAEKANKVRKKPLRVILNGLGKDAAQIISRINGFTYVETKMNYYTGEVEEVFRKCYSSDPESPRAKVNCYGANDVTEGVAIMWKEGVDVSITGNSTNPTRFQHPVAGTYKKECVEKGKKYFSVASGGGTGRTLHPDNMAAGPASYGMTDTMGRMHSDAQFAGSSSVPAHVEMMGLIGAGNNPMVGMTVAVAVSIQQAAEEGRF